MSEKEIKAKGVLHRNINGCQMYLVLGKWDVKAKKPAFHYYMISEKTGMHLITTNSSRPDERVNTHWDGFLTNQNR